MRDEKRERKQINKRKGQGNGRNRNRKEMGGNEKMEDVDGQLGNIAEAARESSHQLQYRKIASLPKQCTKRPTRAGWFIFKTRPPSGFQGCLVFVFFCLFSCLLVKIRCFCVATGPGLLQRVALCDAVASPVGFSRGVL
jgi:hypothetical protein